MFLREIFGKYLQEINGITCPRSVYLYTKLYTNIDFIISFDTHAII